MNKLEKHIKNTLEQRNLQPAATSWNKIASQLDAPAKKKPLAIWWAVAATVMVALGLFTYFKVSNVEFDSPTQLVEVEKNSNTNQKGEEQVKISTTKTVGESTVVVQGTRIKDKGEKELVIKKQQSNVEQVMPPKKEELAQAIPVKDQQLDSLVNGKLAQVLAKVTALEASQNASLLDSEIDSLLLNAQKEILQEKILRPNGKVDAVALLAEVETELDQNFRDKVFDKLKDGFFKVRTAVAERNQ
ncbi:hypothetical protein [Croceivirga sp. JEA036]|uniref:hypothetical protein n=1 Tax=Croceivirga sp. JEA036 TaxID=2721162 RepID=UPI00143BBAFC|nr:hypothetical protein [Croceivirga sp. JEA036]NJB36099.1 hypothetical protein [Croceivirga sp. JEA036]